MDCARSDISKAPGGVEARRNQEGFLSATRRTVNVCGLLSRKKQSLSHPFCWARRPTGQGAFTWQQLTAKHLEDGGLAVAMKSHQRNEPHRQTLSIQLISECRHGPRKSGS